MYISCVIRYFPFHLYLFSLLCVSHLHIDITFVTFSCIFWILYFYFFFEKASQLVIEVFKCKIPQFSFQLSFKWSQFWLPIIQIHVSCIHIVGVAVSESFQFLFIAWVFKGLVCSNYIQILSLLWNHSWKKRT